MGKPGNRSGQARILVVEDDPAIREMLRETLLDAGFAITEAADGPAGLDACIATAPDIILLDTTMPAMDCIEFCRRLRQSPGGAHIPVLMLTAGLDDAAMSAACAAGVTDFLQKPVSPTLLEQRVERLVAAHRADIARSAAHTRPEERVQEALPQSTPWQDQQITRHARGETTLRDSQERYRSAFTDAAIGMAFVTLDGRFLQVNPALCGLTGYSEQELLRLSIQDITHPDDLDADLALMQQVLAGNTQTYRIEKRYLHKLGTIICVHLSVSLVRDESGRALHFISQIQDVSAQKQIEHELRKAKDAAEAATRAKSTFLATMSHEFRTPMNGLIGMIDLLLTTTLTAEQQELAEVAHDSANALLAIISDILDFSTIDAGNVALNEMAVPITGVIAGVVDLVRPQALEKKIDLRTAVAPNIAPDLIGDPHRLRQVLLNLLNNAIKFTSRGSVLLQATVETMTNTHTTVRFAVQDTGIGIAAETLAQLFTPFTQADTSTTRTYGGSGLGLTIATRLVELMGGTMGVSSREGVGSTFWFTVPFRRVATDLRAPDSATGQSSAGLDARRPALILVAEDNPVNQNMIRAYLEQLGYLAESAGNGREAIAAVAGGRYDLVLMDCQMPELDGFEATREIRRNEAHQGSRQLPIIAMTASATEGDLEAWLAAGMDDYLRKPVQASALQAMLQRWLPGLAAATNGS